MRPSAARVLETGCKDVGVSSDFFTECCMTASAGRSDAIALLVLAVGVACTAVFRGGEAFGAMAGEGKKLGALAFSPLVVSGGFLFVTEGEGGTEIGGVGRGLPLVLRKADCTGIFKDVRGEIDFSARLEIDVFLLMCRFVLEISTCDE